jgi:hydroxyacylglutathione hydrolase
LLWNKSRQTRPELYIKSQNLFDHFNWKGEQNLLLSGNMEIESFELGPFATNAFLLWNHEGGKAVLLDAPLGAEEAVPPFLAEQNLTLTDVYLTHGHWDHFAGLPFLETQNIQTWLHPDDRLLVEQPELASSYVPPGLPMKPAVINHDLIHGQRLKILGQSTEIRHVPGHCAGNVLFFFPAQKTAIVGDAIFAGSIGRTDLPGGDFPTLEKAIREQIYTLPDDTILLPGHGPMTTVAQEKVSNPYVRPK